MTKSWGGFWVALTLLAGAIVFIQSRYTYPYPPLSLAHEVEAEWLDVAGVAGGFRRMTADIAWVQLLVYYGAREGILGKDEELDQVYQVYRGEDDHPQEEDIQYGAGTYPRFLPMIHRIISIDPYFTYAYLYGSGVLVWNLNQPKEAVELLQLGMKYNPKEWRFPVYIAAIVYQQQKEFGKMAGVLEQIIQEKEAPNLLRSVLANFYKDQKQYRKALKIWAYVESTGDPEYLERSRRQMEELQRLLGKN